jgi:hypothetical protein
MCDLNTFKTLKLESFALDLQTKNDFRDIERKYHRKYTSPEFQHSFVRSFGLWNPSTPNESQLLNSTELDLDEDCGSFDNLTLGAQELQSYLNNHLDLIEAELLTSVNLYWRGIRLGNSARSWQRYILENASIANSSLGTPTVILRCCWTHIQRLRFNTSEMKWKLLGEEQAKALPNYDLKRHPYIGNAMEEIKALYNHTCQRCRVSLKNTPAGSCMQACHINPHANGGVETFENLLCLCPNCHALFDRYTWWPVAHQYVYTIEYAESWDGQKFDQLMVLPNHRLSPTSLAMRLPNKHSPMALSNS